MFKDMIDEFLEDLAKEAIKTLNKWLVDLMDIALNSQSYMTNKIKLEGIDFAKLNSVVVKFALALIVLKFIKKGFDIYIMQMDGDPDHDPVTLLTGFFEAIAIAITFYSLYTPIINVFKSFTSEMLKAVGSDGEIQTIKSSIITTLLGKGTFNIILVIIFAIMVIILYIKFIMNGGELLILKYAIPITATGLMDADGGALKMTAKKFLQVGFTVTLQIILLRFSIALLLTMHPIWAIAFVALALKTPNLLAEFLYTRPGGGRAGQTLQAVTNIKRLLGH